MREFTDNEQAEIQQLVQRLTELGVIEWKDKKELPEDLEARLELNLVSMSDDDDNEVITLNVIVDKEIGMQIAVANEFFKRLYSDIAYGEKAS